MKTILAPTRGGERSFANQDYAIRLAKDRRAKLLFLYVNDVQFLNMVASPIAVDIATDELEEMGEFLVTLAKERAAKQGVEAQTLVKNGVFRAILEDVIRQENVDILAMGTSSEQTGVTTKDYMRDLGRELGETLGIEVILLYNGEALEVIEA